MFRKEILDIRHKIDVSFELIVYRNATEIWLKANSANYSLQYIMVFMFNTSNNFSQQKLKDIGFQVDSNNERLSLNLVFSF